MEVWASFHDVKYGNVLASWRYDIFFTKSLEKKVTTLCFLLIVWVTTSTPKNLQKIVTFFFSCRIESYLPGKSLIHSMLIIEVNNMRNFIFLDIHDIF